MFEFSKAFKPGDRAGLTAADKDTVSALAAMLKGFFEFHVKRRFSLEAYTPAGPGIRPRYEPEPLTGPSLTGGIGASTAGGPF